MPTGEEKGRARATGFEFRRCILWDRATPGWEIVEPDPRWDDGSTITVQATTKEKVEKTM